MANPVTTADIAKHLGLSAATVQHVLNGRAGKLRIRMDTQERVVSAARALGYRPNTSARAMRTGRFGSVALIQPSRNVYLPSNLLLSLTSHLDSHGLHLSVAQLPDEAVGDEEYLPKAVRELTVDGLLINMIVGIPESFIQAVQRHNIPAIWLNSRQGADCVHPDDFVAAQDATNHLLELGHRSITYLGEEPCLADGGAHYSTVHRYAGYVSAMQTAGLTPRKLTLPPYYEQDPGGKAMRERNEILTAFLRSADRPTAMIAYKDRLFMYLWNTAMRNRILVPENVSLLMFHDDSEVLFDTPVTTMVNRMGALSEAAVSLLIRKIADPSEPLAPVAVRSDLIVGQTTGKPLAGR